nr:polycomb group protein EMBRYONIC FLOWER 2-like [Ipomoea batatas]GMD05377.1 polycomb group protein EMBRYONIC FLOWER 2-like [Ipomoea batatas]GMD09238.1 polycomb group protein EMBRYONIC FLOWER 2-like [Ipomoea batatas]
MDGILNVDVEESVPRSCLPSPERLRHDNAYCGIVDASSPNATILCAAGQDLNDYPDSVESAPELQFPPPAKIQHAQTRKVESVADDSMKYGY